MLLAFWVFIPGPVLLIIGLLVFNWRNRKRQAAGNTALSQETGKESAGELTATGEL